MIDRPINTSWVFMTKRGSSDRNFCWPTAGRRLSAFFSFVLHQVSCLLALFPSQAWALEVAVQPSLLDTEPSAVDATFDNLHFALTIYNLILLWVSWISISREGWAWWFFLLLSMCCCARVFASSCFRFRDSVSDFLAMELACPVELGWSLLSSFVDDSFLRQCFDCGEVFELVWFSFGSSSIRSCLPTFYPRFWGALLS